MSAFKQRIEDTQKRINALRDDVAELMSKAEAEGRDLSGPESVQLQEYAEQISGLETTNKNYELAEKAMAERKIEKASPAIVQSQHLGSKERTPGEIIFKQAVVDYLAHVNRANPLDVMKAAYPTDQGLHAVIKTAINPAETGVAGWAQELTDDARRGFLDILRGESIAASLFPASGMMLVFDGYTALKIPSRAGANTDLASGFTGEGDAIPVRRMTTATQTINPYKWAAISTFTKELAERSVPNIQTLITQGILADTATKLDNDFFGVAAAVAGFRPAGVYNGVTGTAAATGGTTVADDMLTDLRNLIDPIYAANMGQGLRLVMHPTNNLAMSLTLSNGEYLFRDELANGSLYNVPVTVSTNCPLTELWALDMAQIAIGLGTPMISVSDTATIVEVNDDATQPAMSVAQPRSPNTGAVGGAGGANTTTPLSPVRSLFQTEAVAVKIVQYLSWAKLRSGCVNRITGVAY